MTFWNQIRQREAPGPMGKQALYSFLVLLLGIALGTFSKYLDCTPGNELPAILLPAILDNLDVRNFLGRFAFWIFMGLWIAVSSGSAGRAAVNVFLFFLGMVASYYLYSKYVAGFFPRRYAMVWFGFTVISPLLALPCWYAGGKGKISFVLSVVLLAALFRCCFVGWWELWFYVEPRSRLELLTFLCAVWVLRRPTLRESGILAGLGIILGVVFVLTVPFHFG